MASGAPGKPPRPVPIPQPDEAVQPSKQKPKVPVLEKHLVDQLSTEEQDSLNSKFQEATDAEKKVGYMSAINVLSNVFSSLLYLAQFPLSAFFFLFLFYNCFLNYEQPVRETLVFGIGSFSLGTRVVVILSNLISYVYLLTCVIYHRVNLPRDCLSLPCFVTAFVVFTLFWI